MSFGFFLYSALKIRQKADRSCTLCFPRRHAIMMLKNAAAAGKYGSIRENLR